MPLHGFSMLKFSMKGKKGAASERLKPSAGVRSSSWLYAFRDFAFSLDLYVSTGGFMISQTRHLKRGTTNKRKVAHYLCMGLPCL